jgi:cation-transporting ATPase 13A2
LLREVIQPLYIFIIASIVVWMIDNYIYYCAIIFVTGAVGVITNLYQTN